MNSKTLMVLCSYFKGNEFLEEAKELGNKVILITSDSLKQENWKWSCIDEVFYMHDNECVWNLDHMILGIAHLLRTRKVDMVVALDDFDVEKAALVRETFRIPGMGQSTQRYFRDKFAMRVKAKEEGIAVPEYIGLFNDQQINEFADKVLSPWVLKPRMEASGTGILKLHNKEELWKAIHNLGDNRHKYLLEQFRPGDVYHVDSIVFDSKVIFNCNSQYLATPLELTYGGGIFRTRNLDPKSEDSKLLDKINKNLLTSLGMKNGISHTEFIKCKETGKWYFLETSARVGGAHISDLVEAATGINLWKEWAIIENAVYDKIKYKLPKTKFQSAGLIVSLVKDKYPNMSFFQDETLYRQLSMDHHVAVVYACTQREKITEIINQKTDYIQNELLHILPHHLKPVN